MKITYVLPIFLLFLQVGFTQKLDSRIAETQRPLDQVELLLMPPLDNGALLEAELERRAPGVAPRFAETMHTNVTPQTHGNWEELASGQAVWRLRILSEDAYSLNLGFTEFYLPEGGTLILYSPDTKHVMGPFTPADNEAHEQLWTPIFDGDALVVEVQLPQEKRQELMLRLSSVNHDFIGFSSMGSVLSGACNLDVICGEADGWGIVDNYRDIIQSVAVIGLGGGTFCTGFLINNTRQDCTPYFMTAAHCGVNSGNAASLVAYWNFENNTCRQPNSPQSGGAGNGSLADFNSGSIFRAGYGPSDFTLVELDDPVSETANAYFAGWNANEETTSDTTICVHHPSTDEKRISFEFGDTYVGDWGSGATEVPGGDHLIVPDWDIGTTEGGSSGAPLFNKNKQVVGQLHGGAAACGNNSYDSYGWFFSSWEGGGTPTTRLRDWLDPDDTGVLAIDGRWEMACNFFIAPDVTSQQICAPDEAVYSLEVSENFTAPVTISVDGVPVGANAELSANPVNGGDIITLTISNTGATAPGVYTLTISGTDGVETTEVDVSLDIFGGIPAPTALESPADGEEGTSTYPTYSWTPTDFADTYDLQVASDVAFTDLIMDMTAIESTNLLSVMLDIQTTYYWRVRSNNTCGTGEWTAPSSFTTAAITCAPTPSPNIPIQIPENGEPSITSTIEITTPGSIADLRVTDLNIEHSWVGDLVVTLTSPTGTEIILFDRPGVPSELFGCGGDNLELGFDDFAMNTPQDLEASCADLPAISGVFQPIDPFSSFAGESAEGTWTLSITDNADQDGGNLISWALDICSTIPNDAAIVNLTHEEVICQDQGINGEIVLGAGFQEPVELSLEGLPDGVMVNWSENPATPGSVVTFTTTGILEPGMLDLTAVASTSATSSSVDFTQTVNGLPAMFDLVNPANGATGQPQGILLTWNANPNAAEYLLTVATDPELTNIFVLAPLNSTVYNLSGLDLGLTYYWQVEAVNDCGSTFSEVFSFSTMLDLVLNAVPPEITICQSETGTYLLNVGADFGEERTFGFSVEPSAPLDATFMIDPGDPSTVTATLTNVEQTEPDTYTLIFSIDDGTNSATSETLLNLEGPPAFTTLLSPLNGSTIMEQSPELDWTTIADANSYTIEIAETDLFSNIVETATVEVSSYTVTSTLAGGTYYWRISTNNECGSSISAPRSFTVVPSSLRELNGRRVDLLPNPTSGNVNVQFSEPLPGELTVEVFSVNGQQLQRLQFAQATTQLELNLSEYAAGVYLVRLINQESSLSRRIILQK